MAFMREKRSRTGWADDLIQLIGDKAIVGKNITT
jgi:hypothetical protein